MPPLKTNKNIISNCTLHNHFCCRAGQQATSKHLHISSKVFENICMVNNLKLYLDNISKQPLSLHTNNSI